MDGQLSRECEDHGLRRRHPCAPGPAVEDENLLGSEGNTVGSHYGTGGGDCARHTSEYLANPALPSVSARR